MYYILTSKVEDDTKDAILEGDSPYLRRISCSFREGISLPFDDIDTPIPFNLYEFTLRGEMTNHLIISDIRGPIFSIKTKQLFDKARIKNIEYYQLKIIDDFFEGKHKSNDPSRVKGIEYNNYFIANVVGLIDCVNHEKSITEYFYPPELRSQLEEARTESDDSSNPFAGENPNEIDFITKLVLDETKIDVALKIFRLKDQPKLLVFHESVVEQIKKEKLSGFVFVPVEKYTDAIPDDEVVDEEVREERSFTQEITQLKPKQEPPPAIQKEKVTDKKKGRFDSLLNWKEQDK